LKKALSSPEDLLFGGEGVAGQPLVGGANGLELVSRFSAERGAVGRGPRSAVAAGVVEVREGSSIAVSAFA